MAKKKNNYLTMVVHQHGLLWWCIFGWWWRPAQYLFWMILSSLTGSGLKKLTIHKKEKGA